MHDRYKCIVNYLLFRNLSKPMAIQNKKMEDHYLKNYRCLENEVKRVPPSSSSSNQSSSSVVNFGPYHYGSHYSNSGIVVHFLVRLPPFTNIALEYQGYISNYCIHFNPYIYIFVDDNFDIPDRLFNSMETTWRLASSDSTTDFKELTPEFFFLPEFLINIEGMLACCSKSTISIVW